MKPAVVLPSMEPDLVHLSPQMASRAACGKDDERSAAESVRLLANVPACSQCHACCNLMNP